MVVVFALTLSALYGLGMMLASLFLLWGREAFNMTNVLIEPVYFVSGLNFPVGRLGALGALAIATLPFAVGLDAMRQLVFAGQPYITGTPPPEVEALILAAMTVVFTLLARWLIRSDRADGPLSRHPLDPLAMSAITSPGPGAPAGRRARPARRRAVRPARTEGAGLADTVRSLRTSLLLGWRIESNWTDPTLFVIYTVAKPIASLLLLVVMIQIIGGAASDAARTFVILGSALWATVIAGIQGPAWSVLDDRERYRMLKYLAVSPSTLLVLLVGRGGRAPGGGSDGHRSRARVLDHHPRAADRPRRGPLAVSRRGAGDGHRAGRGGRHRARGDLPPDPPGELVVPRGPGRGDVPADRRGVPARDPAGSG